MLTKNKLVFIGSSHAKRLCHEANHISEITNKYTILDFTRPGSLFENLIWPERSTLTKNDIIIYQSFGNNLLQRHTYKNNGIFHLTKFVPNKLSYLEKIFKQLSQKLSDYPCKIYVIDNIYRHLDCCKKHYYKGLVQFQRKANVLLQKSIESNETKLRIQYLDHRRFLGINFRKIWKITSYKKVMHKDGVHLKEPLYKKMISVLAKKFLLRAPANNCTSGPG